MGEKTRPPRPGRGGETTALPCSGAWGPVLVPASMLSNCVTLGKSLLSSGPWRVSLDKRHRSEPGQVPEASLNNIISYSNKVIIFSISLILIRKKQFQFGDSKSLMPPYLFIISLLNKEQGHL